MPYLVGCGDGDKCAVMRSGATLIVKNKLVLSRQIGSWGRRRVERQMAHALQEGTWEGRTHEHRDWAATPKREPGLPPDEETLMLVTKVTPRIVESSF